MSGQIVGRLIGWYGDTRIMERGKKKGRRLYVTI
jgi:hypothetical protein